MLIGNKIVITLIPAPATIFCIQLASAVAFILVFRVLGFLQVDTFTVERVKLFAPYIILFVISCYCNGMALAASNAETVIVFRASTPVFVSVMDYFFLDRLLPSRRSQLSLAGVTMGAIGYMQSDSEFQMNGIHAYFWVIIYTAVIVLEMTYGKLLLSKVKFDTPVWGSVLYTNLLSLPPMVGLAFASGEMDRMSTFKVGTSEMCVLAVSCSIGIGIGWSGWNCRGQVSATSFTLIGVVCKLITLIVNVLIWNKHATPIGIAWLLVCLGSSTFYQQAPLRHLGSPDPSKPAAYLDVKDTKLGNIWDTGDEEADASGLDSGDEF